MNNYAIKTITAAAVVPVTTAEAKTHLAIDDATFDTQIDDFVKAAIDYLQNRTGRQFCTATLELRFDKFPVGRIYLPKGELQSITSVKYIDTSGVEQTVDSGDYLVSDSREPAFVEPAYGNSWPIARDESDAIRVRFVCGYGVAAAVPNGIKQAILLMVGHMFENREAVMVNASPQSVPMAVDALIDQYRLGDDYVWYDQAD